jgi:hypothetical protein
MKTLDDLANLHLHVYHHTEDAHWDLWPIVQLHDQHCEIVPVENWDLSVEGEVTVSLQDLWRAVLAT